MKLLQSTVITGTLLLACLSARAQEPSHTPQILQRATRYTQGYVFGANRTIEAGQAGTFHEWRPIAALACGSAHDAFTDGCEAGVGDAVRWLTEKLKYTGPTEWLSEYDEARAGHRSDCGNGETPGNDGCNLGLKAHDSAAR